MRSNQPGQPNGIADEDLPVHMSFNYYTEFLAFSSWEEYLASKAMQNQPPKLGADETKSEPRIPRFILMGSGLIYLLLDTQSLETYPLVTCAQKENFDPRSRSVKVFSFFRRQNSKLFFYDIDSFVRELTKEGPPKMLAKRSPQLQRC